ncbi:MAG: hypothetical protein LBH31_02750 [Burkholderiaceae bacterium]|nr:hypothetical protein [Burkholderiaceae bacterium]
MTAILVVIVVGVVAYLFLMAFYAVNRNWAAPLVLSPTQQKVLAYQPQIAAMEAALLKNEVDLATAKQKYAAITGQIGSINALIGRFDAASAHEADKLATASSSMRGVLEQKRRDNQATVKAVNEIRPLLDSINDELAQGLITKTEASSRRLTIQNSINGLTDAQAAAISLAEQERAAQEASRTLGNGQGLSLQALASESTAAQLRLMLAQANVDAETARQSVEQLGATLQDANRVLSVAKQSPYYLALTRSVPVAFVPYDNLSSAKPGAPVYDCYLQMVLCRRVGTVDGVYDAEEYGLAPLFKTNLKGKLIGITFSRMKSSQSALVFIGYKPLLF